MKTLSPLSRRFLLVSLITLVFALSVAALTGCGPSGAGPAQEPLILYDFADDIPQTLLDAFTAETGLRVDYQTYESTEEAVAALRAGERYDVVVMENRFIQPLVAERRLAEIDTHRLENFKNIALNFRGLVFDPQNRYSVPYSWGTTGLVVRPDLVAGPVSSWNDLWAEQYWSKAAIWRGQQREVIALTLKSLGYSANSEDPGQMAQVRDRLIELRKHIHFVEEWDPLYVAPAMAEGKVVLSMGYAYEAMRLRELGKPADFVLPKEGALLWGDNFVIPATSRNQRQAEQFIDFLLRPDIAAQLVEQNYFQLANDAAVGELSDTLRNDPLLFPPNDQLHNAEIVLPLSPAGEALCDSVWQDFLNAAGPAPKE